MCSHNESTGYRINTTIEKKSTFNIRSQKGRVCPAITILSRQNVWQLYIKMWRFDTKIAVVYILKRVILYYN